MPSLADIPDDLLNPEEPDLFFVWVLTQPGDIHMRRELLHLYESQTGAKIPPRLRHALDQEDRRRNG